MAIIETLTYLGLPPLAFLVGSIPFGLILTTVFTDLDIRTQGSGNIGATNVLRSAGVKLGLITLFLDALKGTLPVCLAIYWMKSPISWGNAYPLLVAMAAFLGHLYPIYFRLRGGGKGVATAWGCFLALSPLSALTALLVFMLVVVIFKRVSLASLSAAAILPISIWFATHALPVALFAALVTLLIVHRHRQNIVRLLQGKEPVIWGNQKR
jgi:acyl phosphate:glycerol-3-phosphate acyltransferase